MRMAPASPRMVSTMLAAALLPFLPVVLIKYPVADLVSQMFRGLVGL
jgi:hypothetical protein